MPLSPLALENQRKLTALAALIAEFGANLSADLASPENQTEKALTGDEFFGALQGIVQVCRRLQSETYTILGTQPEYLERVAEQKPDLND